MLRFDMMEIMLSRLEDEPTNQRQFEVTRFNNNLYIHLDKKNFSRWLLQAAWRSGQCTNQGETHFTSESRLTWKNQLEVKILVAPQVEVEEHLYGKEGEHVYGRPVSANQLGRCKAIKLTFNDPHTTQARLTFTFLCSQKKRAQLKGSMYSVH